MRLRARPYLHWAPITGGVYVSGARTDFVLRGPQALTVVLDTCVPMLELGTTEDELVAAMGTEKARPAVRLVVSTLAGRDLLLPLDRMSEPEPAPDVRARYAATLAHLEARSDDPFADFARLRASSVLLHGPDVAVLPAVRALVGCGVGHVSVLGPVSATTRGAVLRVGAVLLGDDGPAPAGDRPGPDLVVCCCDEVPDATETCPRTAPGATVAVLPVRLRDDVITVGPLVRRPADQRTGQVWAARARAWAAAGPPAGAAAVARPGGDAMAGALAGALAFEALSGEPVDGRASVVSGDELEVEQVQLAPEAVAPAPPVQPGSSPESVPDVDGLAAATTRLTARWTGTSRVCTPPDLLQIPVAVCVLEDADGSDPSAGWGWDQPSALLSALLGRARRAASSGGAAGVTRQRWLLDGVLRCSAVEPASHRPVEPADLGPRAVQVLRAFSAAGGPAVLLGVRRAPGLEWVRGQVVREDSGQVLAAAWAPDSARAVESALALALVRLQLSRLPGQVRTSPVCTDALVDADPSPVAALQAQVDALTRAGALRLDARPAAQDPVLGPLPVHRGRVVAEAPVTELARA